MNLFYFHVSNDVPLGHLPQAAVVIDVLRATTTIACALNNGADSVETFADIEDLKKSASNWPNSSKILLGERGGKPLKGFDLGNSPNDVTSDLVKGKRLFMSTTNGTRSLSRLKEVPSLYTMSLINRKAVADQLLSKKPEEVYLLGSGWEGSYSLEDSLAAGSLASYLLEKDSINVNILNDELNSALSLWAYWKNDLEGCLRKATHGQRLERLGNHDDDFATCSALDKIEVVPSQKEPGVLRSL
ncbi:MULTISPECIES: 2-phosphosulfolactate phosphatase family protein [Prochlorococcus]|uniref:2-phosphosulfolactate phosphatase family protein n=1 Tax=Prochlorococcus TaxID=1218 RepID=UPI0005607363|nr:MULTISPECIES: 2-phosphosulfolactate phosphatase family protein [Prochlorococcus]